MTLPKISKSVGRGGVNLPIDVAIIQVLLNAYFKSHPNYDPKNSKCHISLKAFLRSPLRVDGDYMGCFHTLEKEVEAIQYQIGGFQPDGRIDPKGKTLQYIVSKAPSVNGSGFEIIFGKQCLIQTGILKSVNPNLFESHFSKHFAVAKSHGLRSFVTQLKNDPYMVDLRWAAYTLATAYHETAFTFDPVDEIGKGRGYEYGKIIELRDKSGRVYKNAYYGRGYVQLTWKDNYEYIGKAIGVSDLVYKPEKANDVQIAYKILSYWVRMKIPNVKGDSKTLKSFINGSKKDYKGARRIVNGTDKDAQIAEYAEKIEMLLRLSSKNAFE